MLRFRDYIYRGMGTSKVTWGILLHCSKAFYKIDYLAEKLYKSNFFVQALKLIHNYLSERKQFVQVDDKSSFVKRNNFGVIQGSILLPSLFKL